MSKPADRQRLADAARWLLGQERNGVLATLELLGHRGYPFASLAPYALNAAGEPILLLSDLAVHTRNIDADPRASLFVQDSAALANPQAGSRLTVLGIVERIAEAEVPEARERYVARHPQAADYFQLGDFNLYVLRPSGGRFVAGFGEMDWLEPAALEVRPTTSL